MSEIATPTSKELFPARPLVSAGFALLAGLLLPLSLAPFGSWWLAFISVVLLLSVLQGASFRQAMLRWYLFGIGQYLIGASWVFVSIHTHGGASVLLAGVLTGLFVLAVALPILMQGYLYQRFFALRKSWLIAFPALWFFKEWSMTWLLSAGFPWALLGYGQINTPLAGLAPLVGVLGLGFVVSLVACLFFAGVIREKNKRWTWWGFAASMFVAGFISGLLEFNKPSADPMRVSLVQGNVAQQTKWHPDMVQPIVRNYTNLSEQEWGRDLIVWPEAAITVFEDRAGELLGYYSATGVSRDTALLLGIPSREGRTFYNSAVVLGSGSGKYIKRHLVPFGEYVPLEDYIRGIIQFFDLPMSHNKPGPDQQELLRVGDVSVALSICYEIAFPNLVRRDAGQAGLLVTISNDTWFGESLGPHQHMQMAQMRALENGRYLLRGTNNGITAVVDPRGKIVDSLPQFEAAVLRGTIVPMQGLTPYTRLGDWPLLISLFAVLLWLGPRRAD